MKFSHYKGFTLVELMIVIAIIGILIVAMQRFSASPSIYQERATRLAEMIYDSIRDQKMNTITGKEHENYHGTSHVLRNVIVHSKNNGNEILSMVQELDKNGNLWYQHIFSRKSAELDGDPNFQIEKIEVGNKNSSGIIAWDPNPVNVLDILLHRQMKRDKDNDMHIGFSNYRITVDYKWFKRYVVGDFLTGNAEIKTQP